MVKFLKVNESAKLPEFKSVKASGADLYSVEDLILRPAEIKIVSTGLQLADCPNDVELQIRSRSGLATKGIVVANSPGTVDADYRGEIKVILANIGLMPFTVRIGDRIAQIIPALVHHEDFIFTDKIIETERGEKGLGSTGV